MDDTIYFKVAADLSELKPQFQDIQQYWDQHNADIAKGERAIKDYSKTASQSYEAVNKKIKENISKVGDDAKALDNLDKKLKDIAKDGKSAFNSDELKKFTQSVRDIPSNLKLLEDLNPEEFDILTKKLAEAKDDFEALNVIVDFFEQKMNSATVSSTDSVEVLRKKIEETKLNLASTKDFIKDIDKDIDSTAPGKVQAGLIQEREAAKQALKEETVALVDYEQQIKKVAAENVSLTTQLRKVKDELAKLDAAGDRDTERYRELQAEAQKYNTVLKETNAELNRTSSSTRGLDNLIGAVTGLVGVFSAAEGAQALFGDESEDLGKALVKLNGAIALLNGLQAIQAELAKKDAISTKALSSIKKQYTIVTNASATATNRFAAALKLLGIGLVIGGIAFLVTNFKEIAKFLGLTSDAAERLNDINKTANELYGEQSAELKVLVNRVKEGKLSFEGKRDALKKYNETFGETFGKIETYAELEKKLIEQGDDYIRYLGLKAKAEAAYQLAIEKSKQALESRSDSEIGVSDFLRAGVSSISGAPTTAGTVAASRNANEAKQLEKEADELLNIQTSLNSEMEKLADELGLVLNEPSKELQKQYEKLGDVLQALIKRQRNLKTELIDSDRDREKQLLKDQIEDEKNAYREQIDNLKIAETAKARLREEFNNLYNSETGIAYEKLRSTLLEIDKKYDAKLESVQFKALSAIDAVIGNSTELERNSIKEKWDNIRDEINEQIKQTNDEFKKEGLASILVEIDTAEKREINTFDLNADLDRIDRETEIADSILRIYQENTSSIIENERLKQRQILELQENALLKYLQAYRKSIDDIDNISLFDSLIESLTNSTDPEVLNNVAKQIKDAFGEDVASEILETVAALKEVGNEIDLVGKNSSFQDLIDDIGQWTDSLESFALKLAETLGLTGREAIEFADGVATAINSTFDSLSSIFQSEIDEQRNKLDVIQDTIDGVEDSLERERELYENGYANNYEVRQKDLEDLKAQKREEEEELKKAQKRKAALQKAEFLIDTVSQLSNLITASTNIFKWASKIPLIGVPLAIGLIGTMFGAFAVAKTKAFSAIGSGANFREGIKKGKMGLSGPSHEEGGFGLYNSKTGERVAEYEGNEDLYAFNPVQRKKYDHILQAMLDDVNGRKPIKVAMQNHYGFEKVGPTTMRVVERVNNITLRANDAKSRAAESDISIIDEIRNFRNDFREEFDGYRKERDEEIRSWETSKFHHVKQGNVTKKYPKHEN